MKNKEETSVYNHYMEHEQAVKRLAVDSSARPIYGVLTEPLSGTLTLGEATVESFNEYIPTAHVQFLEQAAIKVVPISYKLSMKDIIGHLKQVNGIYISGDSKLTFENKEYQKALSTILNFASNNTLEKNN